MKKFFSNYSHLKQNVIILLLILLCHFPLLLISKTENPDAAYIYRNLLSLDFPLGYLTALINFETYDFQPVRDLSLYIDLIFFESYGLVISILLNCLIWTGSCYQILKILEEKTSAYRPWKLLLLTCCFSVYPIFAPSLNWGIARKHLLAFFFILCATRELIAWERSKTSSLKVIVMYSLSVLSLPISIGWPAWAFIYCRGQSSALDKKSRPLFASLGIISALLAGINWAYYNTSWKFLEVYPRKASGFEPLAIMSNLGFQVKQILFPYNLTVFYQHTEDSTYFFALLVVSWILIIILSRKYSKAWLWPAFSLFPMMTIISTPTIYYDTYVIVPAFAFFMFLVTTFEKTVSRHAHLLLVPLIIWSYFTWQDNEAWKNPVVFYTKAQAITPSCTNALNLSYRLYRSGSKLPNELFDFIQTNECLEVDASQPPKTVLHVINTEAMILFFEDEIDSEFREKRLKELSLRHYYPLGVYLSYLAKTGQYDKIEVEMEQQNKKLEGLNIRLPYDFIFSETVPEYCRKRKLKQCLKYVTRWYKSEPSLPYFQ
jgi:hypothetical protein